VKVTNPSTPVNTLLCTNSEFYPDIWARALYNAFLAPISAIIVSAISSNISSTLGLTFFKLSIKSLYYAYNISFYWGAPTC